MVSFFNFFYAVTTATLLLIGSTEAVEGGTALRGDQSNRKAQEDPSQDIFPSADEYSKYAICTTSVTKQLFPTLETPGSSGGCTRYFRGVDMTGVVTEKHLFHSNGIRSACDCVIACLSRSASCTNWVYKHTFMQGDGGKRSCTLYSSPNLPSNVTLAYDTATSFGFELLQAGNNPQAGGLAPLTFLDAANTLPDMYGVSGFTTLDQNNRLYC